MRSYQEYKGRRVAKLFPGHGDQPFNGVVKKAIDNAKDGLPFSILYEDGDKEWVSLEELERILVDEEAQETGTGKQRKGGSASRSGGKGAGRKRKASAGEDEKAAAATATNTNGTPATAAAAAGGSRGVNGTASQPSAKRGSAAAAKHTPAAVLTAAAAKDGAAGASSSKPGKKPSSAAAAAAVSAGGAASDANASPSRLLKQSLGLASRAVAAVVGRAMQDDGGKTEQQQQQQRKPQASASAGGPPQRHTYTGPGAAGMPSTSSFVRAGGHVYLTLSSSPSAPWPGGPVDYSLEVQQVLGDLEHSLGEVSSSKRRLLTVRIYFRDINAGLQKFTPLWNEWVDSETLPVLTLVEGAGMAGSSVTLEAVALASSSGGAATD